MTVNFAPFERNEYDRRLAKTRVAMDRAGLDALFVTDPSNRRGSPAMTGGRSMCIRALLSGLRASRFGGGVIWTC